MFLFFLCTFYLCMTKDIVSVGVFSSPAFDLRFQSVYFLTRDPFSLSRFLTMNYSRGREKGRCDFMTYPDEGRES